MRYLVLVALFSFSFNTFSLKTNGQGLSLEELIKIQKMKPTKVNDYLTKKEWIYSSSDKNEDYSIVTWRYSERALTANAYPEFFLYESSEGDKDDNYLKYYIYSNEVYSSIKSDIERLNLKEVDSSIEDDHLVSVYKGGGYHIILTAAASKYSSKYIVEIMRHEVYDKLYQ